MKIKNNGISLIVLVITIIVVIILAGAVVITLSNSGIISKANDAVEKSNLAALKTEITTNLLLSGWYEGKEVTENMLKSIPEVSLAKPAKADEKVDDVWEITKGETTITMYQTGEMIEGKVDIWDGTSEAVEIKEGNWYIYNPRQMKFFADFVNGGSVLTTEQKTLVSKAGYNESDYVIKDDTIVYLMNDLDMGARQKDGVLTTEKTAWTPIGAVEETTFTGIFDGNNHVIRGIYVKVDGGYAGLFGNSNTIQNLTIKDSYIEAADVRAGGIVGIVRKGDIANCHNISTKVVAVANSAGIVGQFNGGEISDCSNTGEIISLNYTCGGIVGNFKGNKVSNCSNIGNIQCGKSDNNSSIVGGIVAQVNPLNNEATVENCNNAGNVNGEGMAVGGIIGGVIDNKLAHIHNCKNYGTVTGKNTSIGGIAGLLKGEVNNCYNEGNIISIRNAGCRIGGIVGGAGASDGETVIAIVQNTYNIGKISIEGDNSLGIGGIIGARGSHVTGTCTLTLTNNYNIGKIEITGTGATKVGGIIGELGEGTYTTNNNYYLSGMTYSADNTVGEEKSSAEMKTSTFVALLNTGLSELAWEIRPRENNGYPVLIGVK